MQGKRALKYPGLLEICCQIASRRKQSLMEHQEKLLLSSQLFSRAGFSFLRSALEGFSSCRAKECGQRAKSREIGRFSDGLKGLDGEIFSLLRGARRERSWVGVWQTHCRAHRIPCVVWVGRDL